MDRTDRGSVVFSYTPDYPASGGSPVASSLAFALEPVESRSGSLPAFFAGLLPEGHHLTVLKDAVKTSLADELSLLLAIGVQNKASASVLTTPLALAGRRYLLRLDPPLHQHLVVNEAAHLAGARTLKIPVAAHTVVRDRTGLPGLLVERFDRVERSGGPLGVPLEDAAQVLNLPPASKYAVSSEEAVLALAGKSGLCGTVGFGREVAAPGRFADYLPDVREQHGLHCCHVWGMAVLKCALETAAVGLKAPRAGHSGTDPQADDGVQSGRGIAAGEALEDLGRPHGKHHQILLHECLRRILPGFVSEVLQCSVIQNRKVLARVRVLRHAATSSSCPRRPATLNEIVPEAAQEPATVIAGSDQEFDSIHPSNRSWASPAASSSGPWPPHGIVRRVRGTSGGMRSGPGVLKQRFAATFCFRDRNSLGPAHCEMRVLPDRRASFLPPV
ncbi:HipA domain-containing protein [Arthrobacter sp. ISL-65]|nr:HipA domain-containing protein [Arthrobacter sp. ISL-65]